MSSSDLLFKGGRLIDPASEVDEVTDVLISGGKIAQIGSISSQSAEVIDIDGCVICPGFVDLHVHLRQPGREDEETIETGSRAAAKGGFTAIQSMPNTDPVCDHVAVAETILSEAKRVGMVDVIPAGSITRGLEGSEISPIGEMVTHSGVRMFTDDGKGVQDSRLLRRAMEYIKGFNAICAEHCDEASLSEGGHMHEGEFSDLLGLKGIPAEAEEIALARDLALAKLTGVRFHVLHVSTAGSIELIKRARADGARVTAEVTPHHLTLSDADLVSYDTNFKVNPPLRSGSDVEALRRALAEGVIDAIATDHAPHAPEEKEAEFELAPPGMLGLETVLAVMLTHVVDQSGLDLARLIAMMSTNPARILGLETHGGPIQPGAVANLAVFDPSQEWVVDPANFESPVKNSPFNGRTLRGRVLHTVFNGTFTLRDTLVAQEVRV